MRRIVVMEDILPQLHDLFDDHFDDDLCTVRHWQLDPIKHIGDIAQASKCHFVCTTHNSRGDILSYIPGEHMDVGNAAVGTTISSDMGFAQFQEFMTKMSIPCMSRTQFKRKQNAMHNNYL